MRVLVRVLMRALMRALMRTPARFARGFQTTSLSSASIGPLGSRRFPLSSGAFDDPDAGEWIPTGAGAFDAVSVETTGPWVAAQPARARKESANRIDEQRMGFGFLATAARLRTCPR